MKLHDYPETDSLTIALTDAPGTEAREIVEGVVADFDAAGNVVGLDIVSRLAQARSVQCGDDHDGRREVKVLARGLHIRRIDHPASPPDLTRRYKLTEELRRGGCRKAMFLVTLGAVLPA